MGDDGVRGMAVSAGRGQLCRLPYGFDRAFDDFFAKGTVGCACCPTVSTVPLTIFCKRHGRLHRLPYGFDRAFDDFL